MYLVKGIDSCLALGVKGLLYIMIGLFFKRRSLCGAGIYMEAAGFLITVHLLLILPLGAVCGIFSLIPNSLVPRTGCSTLGLQKAERLDAIGSTLRRAGGGC
jgi:hypothetical protein